ncbi:MAG TPA: ABC transporter ATP-binding protein [Steroidobacteraceae bacterium]|nr:ABC transporter ATP-binding protein [Steroidobacteraceae bacterium]
MTNDVAVPLACSGVSKRYGAATVLEDLTLTLRPGNVYGLVGRNGAGKSTLIRILLGLAEPDAGVATALGDDSLHLSEAVKRQLGYVPQQPDAFAWMRIEDMLRFVGDCYPDWDKAYVDAALQRWKLDGRKMLARLSPGERQRVALIRALAPQPRLLVLDEPAAALDPVSRRDLMREIVLRADASGTTVLFSTHIVSDLERVASHLAFLHQGRLLLDTTMDDFHECHALLSLPAALGARLPSLLPGELKRRVTDAGNWLITLSRRSGEPWPALAQSAGASLEPLGLEDLFIEVTT